MPLLALSGVYHKKSLPRYDFSQATWRPSHCKIIITNNECLMIEYDDGSPRDSNIVQMQIEEMTNSI